jgi:hypothetical protein
MEALDQVAIDQAMLELAPTPSSARHLPRRKPPPTRWACRFTATSAGPTPRLCRSR